MLRSAPRLVRLSVGALTAALVLHVAHGSGGIDFGLPAAVFTDWIYNVVSIGAALVCAARALLVRRERVVWALVAIGLLSWSAADVYYISLLAGPEPPPFPSISDLGWLVHYPAVWVALMLLTRRRVREFHTSLWLDGIVAALGIAALVAAFVLPPILALSVQGTAAAVAVNLAYPTSDVLLLALLVGAVALTGWRPDRAVTLLGIGVVLSAVADLSYLDAAARGQYEGYAWALSLWPAASLVTAVAAWQPSVTARPVQLEGRRLLVLPLSATVAAVVLLFIDHFHRVSDLAAFLAFATLLVSAARLWLTLGEHMAMLGASRDEATTDPLTRLGNRRALVRDLDDRVLDAAQHPLLLMLFDLNGFKAYNDTYGHPAGDALLTRLSTALAGAVAGRGQAYRMGGDEFCVLADAPAEQHEDLAALARAALRERGDGFEITAALGTATIDEPDGNWEDLLRDADRRMYTEKDGRRASAGGQSSAVLVRVLTERHPDLGDHGHSVASFSDHVALELGMSAEDRKAVRQAAALHDIGKAAVPDAIVNKPGPLDEDEWAFMRRHTIIGERILQGAPALAAAARHVRSSHERFDGTGYPDRLAGHDIPLGARIIAVCDSYDAMVGDRAYRKGMPREQAVRELRRCAGTQFDPAVVDAFLTVLRRSAADSTDETSRGGVLIPA